MGKTYKSTRAAELESLRHFRDLIDRMCRDQNIDDEVCYDLKLAVDEACTNVVQHGYEQMNPGSIIVEVRPGDEAIEVRITDFGHPFEPSSAPVPDVDAPLEERESGGFGLFFIYQTMDTVTYHSDEQGNTLIITRARSD